MTTLPTARRPRTLAPLFPFLLPPLLASAACSSTSSSPGKPDAAPTSDAASDDAASDGGCTTDDQCIRLLPKTTPANCATASCTGGVCAFQAKDEDGDGYPAAACTSDSHDITIQVGTDCNDHDAKLYPGHSEACDVTEGGSKPKGTLCASGTLSCLPDGSESKCIGTVACSGSETCESGACTTTCTSGSLGCGAGQQPQKCDDGVWKDVGAACTNQACENGVCQGTCSPGVQACADDVTPETCDPTGSYQPNAACVGQACVDGQCGGECAPGATQCSTTSPNAVQTCDDTGIWQPGVACGSDLPACLGGACVACTPGAVSCADSVTPETCDATGAWQPETACQGEACVAGTCTGSCTPGALSCANATTPLTCGADGTEQADAPCVNQACQSGACVGVCSPGALSCSGTQPTKCDATGEWDNYGADCEHFCSAGTCTYVGPFVTNAEASVLTADKTHLYWTAGLSSTTAVVKLPLSGGTPTTLGAATNGGGPMTVDATNVYYSSQDGTLYAIPVAGGTVRKLAKGGEYPAGLVASGADLYWATAEGVVAKVPVAGGSVVTLVSGQGDIVDLTSDATHLYWTSSDGGTVVKMALSGGALTTLASGQNQPGAITVDSLNAYWCTGGSKLYKVNLGGGAVTVQNSSCYTYSDLITYSTDDPIWSTGETITGQGAVPIASGLDNAESLVLGAHGNLNWLDDGGDIMVYYNE